MGVHWIQIMKKMFKRYIQMIQIGELIFLFIISISLHNLRIVSGFFLLNNDDSFNVFGLLKSILE